MYRNYRSEEIWDIFTFKILEFSLHRSITHYDFSKVPVIVNRPSNTKLRSQVKQARLPTKMAVAMQWGLHTRLVLLGRFTITGTLFISSIEVKSPFLD